MGELQTLLALVVLIYVLCVIVQAVQEVLKAWLNTKADTMRKTIDQFMGSLVDRPSVEQALKNRGLDITALEHFSENDFVKLVSDIPLTQQQQAKISTIVNSANATVEQLNQQIAAAYDAALAKFQRSYTRYNKFLALLLSFAVVLGLNGSLIKIYENLSIDQKLSQAIAGTASSVSNASQSGQNECAAQTSDLAKAYCNSRQTIKADVQNYPILVRTGRYAEDFKEPLPEIGGLLLMGLLVSLGAPFWNDVLKGVNGLNNALNTGGKKTT